MNILNKEEFEKLKKLVEKEEFKEFKSLVTAYMDLFAVNRALWELAGQRIIEDKRKIDSISKDYYIRIVGIGGITRIIPYEENGQMAKVTWFAIYKGDFLFERVDSTGMSVTYLEE